MSLAGSTSDGAGEGPLILRPTATKTFLKGVIAVAIFSLFLQLSLANLVHYLIFLGVCLGTLATFVLLRRANSFELGDDTIEIKRLFRKPNSVSYSDIVDISVAQGMMARRFNCGTVFMILKGGPGSVKLLGGGVAEQLEEIHDPQRIAEIITSRLSPYSSFIAP